MGNVFSPDMVKQARADYERVQFTWGPATLANGSNTIFDAQGWNTADLVDKVAVLDSLAATQNSGVQLVWTYDSASSDRGQGWTDAMPAGVRPMAVYAPATSRLSLVAINTTGAPIVGFQISYTVSVYRLDVAERLMYGYKLNDDDMHALDQLQLQQDGGSSLGPRERMLGLVQSGSLPIAWRRTFDALWANRRLPDLASAVPRHVTTASSSQPASFSVQVPNGQVAVLEELAIEGAPAVTVTVDRGSDSAYVTLNGGAFVAGDDRPWQLWVPTTDSFVVSVTGAIGTFPVRVGIRSYRLSELLSLHLGLTRTPAASYAQVRAGLQ